MDHSTISQKIFRWKVGLIPANLTDTARTYYFHSARQSQSSNGNGITLLSALAEGVVTIQ